MPEIVVANDQLQLVASLARTFLDGGAVLQLFQNQPVLTNALDLSFFVQSNFPGYVPINTNGLWGPIFKAQDGIYAFQLPAQTFTASADGNQSAYGWYLNRAGNIRYAGYFTTPKSMVAGFQFELSCEIQVKDVS